MTVKIWQVSSCDSWRVLRSTTGYGTYNNTMTTTSLFSTFIVCFTCLTSKNNLSLPYSNFSYSFPNMTLVADYPLWREALRNMDRPSTRPAPTHMIKLKMRPPGTGRMLGEVVLYYWTDETLNSTWWSHFQSDPFTGDHPSWASWAFYPTKSSKFRCVPASGVKE